ncbi:MAG TPA: ATP-dependent helicase HrpB [Tepidisphaeraceae bacterium]|jgi:ATP-dependent helicase HrpB|nr:ATP-dependent helicase HrpB [Tepidisphaeraceae bacterium]
MIDLPIDEHLPRIVQELRGARAIVIVAEPGAGKTTRVPPAILAANLLLAEHPNLVMLQPRRVAARASAMRIAQEQGWAVGEEVGYHVRFDRKISARTRLRVLTEGILTRQLLDDPFIEEIGCVVLDEFHERNLNTDIAIAMLREVRQSVREDLMLVVMSATLEAEPVAKFLDDCPIVRVPGRTFPIEITHAASMTGGIVERTVDALSREIENARGGDILTFLPGADEIRRVQREIEPLAQRMSLSVFPLHGSLEAEQQMAALAPSRQRKIILATNIAETSLTIDGVTTVIDSGYARVAGFDAQRGLDRLELNRISKASAAQRAGRAGRTAPGRCIRLWSAKEDAELEPFELPEIRRVDLCGTVLAMHGWGKSDPRLFGWFEPPEETMLASAERLLAMLGALDAKKEGQITSLGKRILSLPAHPRLARLLLAAADEGMIEQGATLAALLSEKDISFTERGEHPRDRVPKTQGSSDLLLRMEMLERAERSRFAATLRDEGIDVQAARQIARTREQLLRIARTAKPRNAKPQADNGDHSRGSRPSSLVISRPLDESALLKLALLAYPDRVCRRRGSDPLAGVMVGGGGVRLARESIVTRGEFFLALDAHQDQRSGAREALVRIASSVDVSWLEELFPQSVRVERSAAFDEGRGRVLGLRRVFYRDLLLREDRDDAVDPQQAAAILAESLRSRAREIVESDEAAKNVLYRIALLGRHISDQPWPKLDDTQLAEILANASHGKRGLEQIRALPLASLLKSQLAYPMDRLLETEAPETIVVPTGNHIRLEYSTTDTVVLAVRLQELFGLLETPRIARGRVPVVLHLLGPNYRPVQVTDDLRSFWSRTYPQVRKDLRARYPKHAWPEDPLTAKPEAKGRSRK